MTKKDNIQVLRPSYRVDECLDAIRECLEIGWTGIGFKTNQFEEEWRKYTLLPHAHFVNSATAGLHLAVKIFKDAYGWEDGDEIITTPLTFVSTNHAILYERLFPVFADVHPDTLCLDPASVEEKITTRTRAVMYVGMGGNPGHLNEIRELCKRHNLKLILDAAHMAGTFMYAPGATTETHHVGHGVDVAVFSFQAVKNLPTADGGMICFQDREFDARARKLSWLGIDKDTYLRSSEQGTYKWKYDVPDVGYKYHGNSVMAAMGLVALKYLDVDNKIRNDMFNRYKEMLDPNTIHLIDPNPPDWRPSRHLCQVLVEDRDKVLESLNNEGIYPGVHYVDNTHYRMYRHGLNTCPTAMRASQMLLSLPLHLGMNHNDADRVADTLNEITNGKK